MEIKFEIALQMLTNVVEDMTTGCVWQYVYTANQIPWAR